MPKAGRGEQREAQVQRAKGRQKEETHFKSRESTQCQIPRELEATRRGAGGESVVGDRGTGPMVLARLVAATAAAAAAVVVAVDRQPGGRASKRRWDERQEDDRQTTDEASEDVRRSKVG